MVIPLIYTVMFQVTKSVHSYLRWYLERFLIAFMDFPSWKLHPRHEELPSTYHPGNLDWKKPKHYNIVKPVIQLLKHHFCICRPSMQSDISKRTRSYISCPCSKIHKHTSIRPRQFSIPNSCFEHIRTEFVMPLHQPKGFQYLLTLVDRFTHRSEAIYIKDITTNITWCTTPYHYRPWTPVRISAVLKFDKKNLHQPYAHDTILHQMDFLKEPTESYGCHFYAMPQNSGLTYYSLFS